jgi:hypothetical protein
MSSKKTATLPVGLLRANQTIVSGARYQQRCSAKDLSPLRPAVDRPIVDRCRPANDNHHATPCGRYAILR